ncbi:MAG: hypothetical protein R3E66_24515 [bacterium]
MKRTLCFLLVSLPMAAQASVGMFVGPAPEEGFTQVVMVRDGNHNTIAARTKNPGATAWIVPVYKDMSNVETTSVSTPDFDQMFDATAPRFDRVVRVTNCHKLEYFMSVDPPKVPPSQATSSTKLLTADALKKKYPELSAPQLAAIDAEVKLGAKFVAVDLTAGAVPAVRYDAELLELPTRIGQANQTKTQNLQLVVVAERRIEVSNFWNALFPTNIALVPEVTDVAPIHQSVVNKTTEQSKKAFWVEFAGRSETGPVVTRMRHQSPAGKLDDNATLSPANPLVGGGSDDKPGALGGEIDDFKVRYFTYDMDAVDLNCPDQTLRPVVIDIQPLEAFANVMPSVELAAVVAAPIPEIYVSPKVLEEVAVAAPEKPATAPPAKPSSCSTGAGEVSWLLILGFAGLRRRRRAIPRRIG